MSEIVVVNSKKELLDFGYEPANVRKEVIFKGTSFLLVKAGKKVSSVGMFSYANQAMINIHLDPIWRISKAGLTMTVTHIV